MQTLSGSSTLPNIKWGPSSTGVILCNARAVWANSTRVNVVTENSHRPPNSRAPLQIKTSTTASTFPTSSATSPPSSPSSA